MAGADGEPELPGDGGFADLVRSGDQVLALVHRIHDLVVEMIERERGAD